MPRPAPLPYRRRRERGSAYIVALLVLVLLTIFGMSLALVTQTESQIGAAEKVATRTLFAGDAGFGVAMARRTSAFSEDRLTSFELNRRAVGSGLVVSEVVNVTPIVQVNLALCSLCALNETQIQGGQFRRTNHIMNATGQVQGPPGADGRPVVLSTKLLSLMTEFQPTVPSAQLYFLDDQERERLPRELVY